MHFLTHCVFFFVSEFGHYAGRVKFESNSPMENSALLIPTTEVSDEGRYTCRVSTFPRGNFERSITLIVWSMNFPPLLAFSFFVKPPPSPYKSFLHYTKKSLLLMLVIIITKPVRAKEAFRMRGETSSSCF